MSDEQAPEFDDNDQSVAEVELVDLAPIRELCNVERCLHLDVPVGPDNMNNFRNAIWMEFTNPYSSDPSDRFRVKISVDDASKLSDWLDEVATDAMVQDLERQKRNRSDKP